MATLAQLYQQELGRAPDAGGLQFWQSQMQGGKTLSDIQRMIDQSAEGRAFEKSSTLPIPAQQSGTSSGYAVTQTPTGAVYTTPGGGRHEVRGTDAASRLQNVYFGGQRPTESIDQVAHPRINFADDGVTPIGGGFGGSGGVSQPAIGSPYTGAQQGNPLNTLGQPLDLASDPGHQFRLSQGAEAIQRAQAAKGMLGSGATLRGLTEFGQQLGSQEYQNMFNRRLQQAQGQEALTQGQFGRGITLENLQEVLRQGQFNRQLGLTNVGLSALGMQPAPPGLPAGQAQMGGLGTFGNLMSGASGGIGQAGVARGIGTVGAGQAWQTALNHIGQQIGQGGFGQLFGGRGDSQYTPTFGGQGFGSANLGNISNFGIG